MYIDFLINRQTNTIQIRLKEMILDEAFQCDYVISIMDFMHTRDPFQIMEDICQRIKQIQLEFKQQINQKLRC